MRWIGADLRKTLHTKWLWFVWILAGILGRMTKQAAKGQVAWNCMVVTSMILISEIFWLFELKSKKDEVVLCTKNGNRWMYQIKAGIMWGITCLTLVTFSL